MIKEEASSSGAPTPHMGCFLGIRTNTKTRLCSYFCSKRSSLFFLSANGEEKSFIGLTTG
jgi:hypothetical protein